MTLRLVILLLAGQAAALAAQTPSATEPSAPPSPSAERLLPYFEPMPGETTAAIAPDGRHLAFTRHENGTLYLHLLDLDERAKQRVVAVADDFLTPEYGPGGASVSSNREKIHARLVFLRWVSAARLVFTTNEGRLYGIDADGNEAKTLIRPKDIAYEPPPRPLDEGEGPPRPSPQNVARQPHVIEILPRPKNQILIEARGPFPERYEVDATTGRFTSRGPINDDSIYDANTGATLRTRGSPYPLYDHEAQARVRYVRTGFRSRYVHISESGRSKDLDALTESPLGFEVTPENYAGRRAVPLGFAYDPNVLYFASNRERDTYGVYALDVRTGKPTGFKVEHPRFDLANPARVFQESALILDRNRRQLAGVRFDGLQRTTQWVDRELDFLQREFDQKLPGKNVEIVDWDEARRRFVLFISNQSDPGGWFVYNRKEGKLTEIARRAPWITPENVNSSGPFAFVTPAGVHLTGYLTLPRTRRIERAPLIVFCPDGTTPWTRQRPGFHGEVQALASMGFAVLQVNPRGAAGFGSAFREAVRGAFDRVPAEDIVAAVDWVVTKEKLHPKLVGLYGQGFGGYIALRTLQLYPERFRCGIVLQPISDLVMLVKHARDGENFTGELYHAWFGGDTKALAGFSPVDHAADLKAPLLIVQDSSEEALQVEALRSALRRVNRPPRMLDVSPEFQSKPKETARAFAEIEAFLNENVYRYATDYGAAQEVK